MQRVVIMGPPGSGKSTLARRIGHRRGLPVFHLDQAFWKPGWVETPHPAFAAEVGRIAALSAWVIDGNYAPTIAPRLSAADTAIYLDVPPWIAVPRIMARSLRNGGRARRDMSPGCTEAWDAEYRAFLRFAWTWNAKRRDSHLALLDDFAGRRIVLRGRAAWRPDLASLDALGEAAG